MQSIQELQSDIEAALRSLPKHENQLPEILKPLLRLAPPKGLWAQVRFRHSKNERAVKCNAPADAWSPDSGVISISYSNLPGTRPANAETQVTPSIAAKQSSASAIEEPARDLLLTLASAEQEPELGFIALKWFRDTYLMRKAFPWAASDENRHRVLVDALNRNWIVTSKLPNPKNPHYPVTTIRVNRSLPEVRSILNREHGSGSAFAPIKLAGEPLSQTVLRERR